MSEFRIDTLRAAGLGEYAAQNQNAVSKANTATIGRNTVSTQDSVDLNERKEKLQEAREAIAAKQTEIAQQQGSAAGKQDNGFWGALGGLFGGGIGALLGGPILAVFGGLFGMASGSAAAQRESARSTGADQAARSKELAELQSDLLKQKEALDSKLEEIEAKKGRAPSAETTPVRYVRA